MTLTDRIDELERARVPFVRATVVRAQEPSSAKAGDRAIVLADGSLEGFVGGRLQGDDLAAADPGIPDDDQAGPGVLDALPERGRAQPGEDHRMDGADAGTGQHGDYALDRQGHVDDDAVALADAQGFEAVGEAADEPVELPVGDDALRPVLPEPDVGGPVAALDFRGDSPVAHVAANLVRQITQMGGDVSPFVSPAVAKRLEAKSRK